MRSFAKVALATALVSTATLASSSAHATGFEFPSNGPEQFSRGSAWLARATDPLAVYYNPAALSRNKSGVQLSANLVWQKTCIDRSFNGDNRVETGSAKPQTYSEVCNDGSVYPNPQLAAQFRLTDKLGIGIAVLGPSAYGKQSFPEFVSNVSNYKGNAQGQGATVGAAVDGPSGTRYLLTSMDTLLVWPQIGVGYEIADNFRVGASFIWGVAVLKFGNASMALGSEQLGPNDRGADGYLRETGRIDLGAKVEAKDLFVPGFTLSTMYTAADMIDLALWFHWSDAIKAHGQAEITGPLFQEERGVITPHPNPSVTKTAEGKTAITPPQPWEVRFGVRYFMSRKGNDNAMARPIRHLAQNDPPAKSDADGAAKGGSAGSAEGAKTDGAAAPAASPVAPPPPPTPSRKEKDPIKDEVFDVELDVHYSHDSMFDKFGVVFEQPTQVTVEGLTTAIPQDASIPHAWKNSIGLRFGGDFNVVPDMLALRAGGFWQSSTLQPVYFHPDFPSSQRVGITGGATFRVSVVDIQAGFGHIFHSPLVNSGTGSIRALTGDTPAGSPETNRSKFAVNSGKMTSSTNILSLGLVARWLGANPLGMSDPSVRNVIIVGSGPAGLTAAIYAARANLKPVCIEGFMAGGLVPGGQLMFTTDVENYPGFPEKVTGPELMKRFRDQAEHQGCEIVTADVEKLDLSQRPFKVWVEGESEPRLAKTVIIATGAKAKYLGLPSEQALVNRGVSACAVCDGALYRNKPVAVVGGGDTAMEEAAYLAGLCSKVYLIHRRDEFRASKAMQERVRQNPKITMMLSQGVDEVLDTSKNEVTGLRLRDLRSGATSTIEVAALFVAIGHQPMSDLVKGQVELHDNGYIRTRPGTTQTSVAGVFAAGDVQDFVFRQAVTAAGSGCMAALEAERFLAANDGH